ncbi:hypothetical protein VTP01DRAFT_9841 [Rhizomucor pusillus]|uniref:uncharacterized protein n=1 Tax=Rhizomucor pusillus TaxID=4840 RepID=UPI0037433328
MKCSMAWSKKGSPAVVTVPETRAKTTTIQGAISASGTVTGHYLSFLKATMDEMDKYSQMKGHYLVMDNAPIHGSSDIGKYITSQGYRYVYLPPYSPELNPIKKFWSVVKSKVLFLTLLNALISAVIEKDCKVLCLSFLTSRCLHAPLRIFVILLAKDCKEFSRGLRKDFGMFLEIARHTFGSVNA